MALVGAGSCVRGLPMGVPGAWHRTPRDGGKGKVRQTCSVASCHTAVQGPFLGPAGARADRRKARVTRHHTPQREGPPALFPRQAPNGVRAGTPARLAPLERPSGRPPETGDRPLAVVRQATTWQYYFTLTVAPA